MLRTISEISQDIKRCQAQITETYNTLLFQSVKDAENVRAGFEITLDKLNDEYTQAIRNITVINPRIYTANGLQELDVSEHSLE